MSAIPSQDRLRELLDYDAETGTFHWRVRMNSCSPAGGQAGRKRPARYNQITINGTAHLAHRLAWVYVHGVQPKGQIDHIDGNRTNNALANLRDVDAATNQQNRRRAQGKNPYPWVTWRPSENRWRSVFRVCGRDVLVGHFHDPKVAYEAAISKRRAMGVGAEAFTAEHPAPIAEAQG